MIYRKFGNTGEKVSALGFGCMRLPEIEKDGKWHIDEDIAIPMLQRAYENGVNYYDNARYYVHGNSERTLGKALKPFRRNVLLSTKIPMDDKIREAGDYRRVLETSLREMDTDYIDFYHFWAISKEIYDNKIVRLKLLKEALKAKEEGLIRHISFSFHDEPENMKYIIDSAEIFESVLVQYNLLDRSCEKQIAYAARKGLGVAAMGTVGGGRLATPNNLYAKLTGNAPLSTYELAFKFVLGNPGIGCALSGMETMEMLEKNCSVASKDAALSLGEWERIASSMEHLRKLGELYCTGCDYCQPCPAGIGISKIFEMYTYHNVYELSRLASNEFKAYLDNPAEGRTSKDCTDCGSCEEKCPQKIKIRRELKKVEEILAAI
jgi:predicted aldo/keto reductase-like oxidoreductase